MAKTPQPAKVLPARGSFSTVVLTGIFVALSVVAAQLIRVATVNNGVSHDLDQIVSARRFLDRGIDLRADYTGIAPVDQGIGTLIAAFMAGPAGWDVGFQVQMAYFLVSFFSVISIWSIESVRKRNELAFIRYTSLWALFYQTAGGAIIIPLYYIAYLYESRGVKYWATSQRVVPLNYAKALLPALVIGYLIPTLALFINDSDPEQKRKQFLIFVWQPTPLYVNGILLLLSRFLSSGSPAPAKKESASSAPDVKYLNTIYVAAFTATAAAHIATFYIILTSADPQHSFTHVFVKPHEWGQSGVTKGLHAVFQADYWIIFLASLVWAYLAVLDLRRLGKTNVSLFTSGTLIVIGSVAVGPAAVLAGVWYWRESVMVKPDIYTL
ncbi:uncharacterized protein A1O9_06200 [Exophiala aquamarina CBS 119918]|uniref:Uncharacterized protein n=1 Tax=Exophiala aquamarina CBS 119918 TaxID=1182545 RepID=A0A072PDZ0_9EURO|nr:uncharacterized protein A1O9_06200 [Exophiala aquamarina CBS 119918]KEF58274.1 hypothetical protein A1O9_06200 [Exophiala aquamarina CBS 119918]